MDVVILAAGRGRRFGGAKQFVPVAPDGATLLEVTAADAHRAGCRRAVIVVPPGGGDEVRALFAARPVPGLEVAVAVQRADDLPGSARAPAPRDRPWGTAHAVWAARHAVRGPFLLFNADDHYGPSAPAALAAALGPDGPEHRFVLLGYPLGTTLSAAGTVSRALCETDAAGRLTALREHTAVDADGRIAAGPEAGRRLAPGNLVSMNAWGFTPAVFPLLAAHLRAFLATADLERDECFLPAAVEAAVRAGRAEVRVLAAPDRWCGLTWPEDRARVAGRLAELAAVRAAAGGFGLGEAGAAPRPFGTGLVHATWRVDGPSASFLLQRLNSTVFADPAATAENAAAAARRVDDALRRRGDTDPRHRLVHRSGPDGRPWLRDAAGAVWRCLVMIAGARPADPARPQELRGAARALGAFPGLVAAGCGPAPVETIPGFHDTPARLAAFAAALAADARGRAAACRSEADRLRELAPLADLLPAGRVPRRPVHNDAKPDNVLVDAQSGEALVVIDLDTVMPGLAPHDFGDLVRAAVTGRPEDEAELDRVAVRRDAFADLVAGYLEGARAWLVPAERDALVDGALAITYEQALRFLADHLAGDVYYRVDEPGHNLRRARAQLRLLEGLLADADRLRRIVATA